jgi:phage baseplate assembly protein W
MRTIKFPKMFNSNSTNVWKGTEYLSQTKQSAQLLLQTERGELFGDPYFGLLIRHYMFDQNDYVLRDVIIDMVYQQIALFLPQVKIDRNDIEIAQDREKGKLYVTFSGINQIDYQPNTYSLVMYDESE